MHNLVLNVVEQATSFAMLSGFVLPETFSSVFFMRLFWQSAKKRWIGEKKEKKLGCDSENKGGSVWHKIPSQILHHKLSFNLANKSDCNGNPKFARGFSITKFDTYRKIRTYIKYLYWQLIDYVLSSRSDQWLNTLALIISPSSGTLMEWQGFCSHLIHTDISTFTAGIAEWLIAKALKHQAYNWEDLVSEDALCERTSTLACEDYV
ncbi:hypothetical protein BD560DRAFT_427284 [Blakeslea trispora]|nr:hypothetical protein BD560DRAFT_427284 [Blakeslea trispora]